MGLYGQVMLFLDVTQFFQQFICAGRQETRCQDGLYMREFLCHICQPLNGFRSGFFCGFPQDVRAVTVHIDFPDHSAQTRFFQQFHEHFCGLTMDGAEDAASCVRAFSHFFHKTSVILSGKICVHILRFLRECMSVQPFQQFQVHAQSTETILGRVHMQVCKTRQNQLACVIQQREILIFFGQLGEHTGRNAVFTNQIPVFAGLKCIFIFTIANIAFADKVFLNHLKSSLKSP